MSSGPTIAAQLSHTIDDSWLRETPLTCGPVPTGRGTPHCFVCVSSDTSPLLRVDVYADPSSYCFREESLLVGGTLFIGVGHSVFVVTVATRSVTERELDCYFGYFHPLDDGALVCTGSSVYRVALDGSVVWAATNIGVDGVLIREVRDGVIRGDAVLDPPGGWQTFAVSLADGSLVA